MDLAARHALRGRRDDLQLERHGRADALDLLQQADGRAEHFGQGAEAGQQRLGDRLGVGARDQAEEQEFQKFIVGQGIRTGRGKALAQTIAMAEIMQLFIDCRLGSRRRPHRHLGEEAPFVVVALCRHVPPISSRS